MRSVVLRTFVWLAAAAAITSPAAANRCFDSQTMEALRLRDLQAMLNVGALRCRGSDPSIAGAYNRFIERSRDRLLRGEELLIRHFDQGSGRAEYDRFTSQISNRHSEAMEAPGRCHVIKRMLVADEDSRGAFFESVAALPMIPLGVGEPCETRRRSTIATGSSPFERIPE